MNCIFCPTIKTKFASSGAVATCYKCFTEYYYENHKLIAWQFDFIYQGGKWWVTWQQNSTIIRRGATTKVVEMSGQITSLTPHNISQKLPTLLTFS